MGRCVPRYGEYDMVVVANRLPVDRAVAPDGSVTWRTSPGGLVAALEPVMRTHRGAWVGWTGDEGEAPDPFEAGDIHLVPVGLDADDVELFYEGMSNSTLWPLYHDLTAPPEFHRRWWERYVEVNRRFAAAAAAATTEGATVWVQDYQLQLTPQQLRAERPDLRIGFFNHIPFPPYELFAQLPWRRQIVEGLLGADLLGFQRPADAGNFLRACRRNGLSTRRGVVRVEPGRPDGVAAREVRAAAFPISIDAGAIDAVARRPDVAERARQIRRDLGDPQTLLLGVDRLDHTKGILHRLQAIEELYQDGELVTPGTVLVQVATPSRERVQQYRRMREQVEVTVGRINGEAGRIGHPAVHYLHHSYPREELVALYLAADLLLVTALRDGMNLVAKEYVAARHDEGGALLLSEFTGAAAELPQAFLVNPHDISGTKAAVLRALRTPPREARRRMRAMRRRVFEHDVRHWAESFLGALAPPDAPSAHTGDPRRQLPPGLRLALRDLTGRHPVLLALDFDGVLAPIVPVPSDARPLPGVDRALAALAGLPGVRVALVSGRALADLRRVADPPDGVLMVGSHGGEISTDGAEPLGEEQARLLDRLTEDLVEISAAHPGTSVERKPAGAVLHTRRAEPGQADRAGRAALRGPARLPGVHATPGKQVVELSVLDVGKGVALRRLRELTGAESVLFAGDDTTDEAAFAVLDDDAGDVTIKVGPGPTVARHRLADPSQVRGMLVGLAESFFQE